MNAQLNGPTKLILGDAKIARIGLGTNRGAALDPDPDRCVVATKGGGGGPGSGRPEILHAETEESLRRPRIDSVALYYPHRVDPETAGRESRRLQAGPRPRQDPACRRIQRLDRRD